MAITWDSVLVAAVARALRKRLDGARLRALHLDRGDLSVTLWFREATLSLRLHPQGGALTLHDPREPPPEARPLQARLEAVDAPTDDRILRLALTKVRGSVSVVDVIVELMTNQWNALLTEGPERTIRHVLRERRGRRPLRPGIAWTPPPPSHREGADASLTRARWAEIVLASEPHMRSSALLAGVAWTSTLTAPALLGAAAREVAGLAVEAALDDGHQLWSRLAAVGGDGALPAATGDASGGVPPGGVARASGGVLPGGVPGPGDGLPPGGVAGAGGRVPSGGAFGAGGVAEGAASAVLLDPDGPSPQPFPLALPGHAARSEDDVLAAMAGAVARGGIAPGAALLPSDLVAALEAYAEAARRREQRLRAELRDAPEPAELRVLGDLLLARFAEVPRGAAAARLAGFDGRQVDVDLDPALPVHENAERYYARAARAERARERLPALAEAARAVAERSAALLKRARSGEAGERELRAALPEASTGPAVGARPAASALPYRRYRSSGGLEIRVGRGSKTNDDLTFRHSSPDDVWLHARHAAGAHVILRWSGRGAPPARDLAEAATLAALHSRARTSGSVPVDWTRRKYVRKPRKAPPGAVLPERVKTLFVEPDDALEARLREP